MPDLSLDLRYLKCAICAAEAGSFRKAAELLCLPQSSVSRRIQLLERRLGFPLFKRSPSGIRVTTAGEAFLSSASEAAKQLDTAALEGVAVHRGQSSDIRIGVPRTSERLRNALSTFRLRFPAVRVTLAECSYAEARRGLTVGELDISTVHETDELANCKTKVLWREAIYVVLPREHRLAGKAEVAWADVHQETFVACAGGPCSDILDCLTLRFVSPTGLPNVEVHAVSAAGIFDLVAMGYGITLTNDAVVRSESGGLVVRPMRGESEAMPMVAIWRTRDANPLAVKLVGIAEALGQK